MRTHNIPSCYTKSKRSLLCLLTWRFTNPHWLELPLYRTNFHGPNGVRATEVRLYVDIRVISAVAELTNNKTNFHVPNVVEKKNRRMQEKEEKKKVRLSKMTDVGTKFDNATTGSF